MAIRFEDNSAPKSKAGEKPVEKARPPRVEPKAEDEEVEAPVVKAAVKGKGGFKNRRK